MMDEQQVIYERSTRYVPDTDVHSIHCECESCAAHQSAVLEMLQNAPSYASLTDTDFGLTQAEMDDFDFWLGLTDEEIEASEAASLHIDYPTGE